MLSSSTSISSPGLIPLQWKISKDIGVMKASLIPSAGTSQGGLESGTDAAEHGDYLRFPEQAKLNLGQQLLGFPTIHVAIALRILSILRSPGNLVTIPTRGQRVVKDNIRTLPARDQTRRQRYQIKMGVSFDKLWEDT